MNRDALGPALGKISSGLYIATAQVDGAPVGMLCSFIEQCSFEPPMISMAVAPGRPICTALDGLGLFGVHILSKDNNALLKSFARGSTPEAFANHEVTTAEGGVPRFVEALAFLLCKVQQRVAAGDHLLYIAEVLDGALQHPGAEASVRVRANGFGY